MKCVINAYFVTMWIFLYGYLRAYSQCGQVRVKYVIWWFLRFCCQYMKFSRPKWWLTNWEQYILCCVLKIQLSNNGKAHSTTEVGEKTNYLCFCRKNQCISIATFLLFAVFANLLKCALMLDLRMMNLSVVSVNCILSVYNSRWVLSVVSVNCDTMLQKLASAVIWKQHEFWLHI